MMKTSCRTAIALLAFALTFDGQLPGQAPKPTEYQVKAAYLYNFGRFVSWPARGGAWPGPSFTLCVLGQDPFGPVLDAVG